MNDKQADIQPQPAYERQCPGCQKTIRMRTDGRFYYFYYHQRWNQTSKSNERCVWSGQKPHIR